MTPLAFNDVIRLVDAVPIVDNDPGQWSPNAIVEILENYRERTGDFGYVYVRRLRGSLERTRARLSGNEVDIIRRASDGRPALVLLYVGEPGAPDAWHPTLVMPENAPGFIISPPE